MKGMLTGPLTILNWSFVRNNQSRYFEQLSLHKTIAVISYRNLSSSIMLCNDAACSMEIMCFSTHFKLEHEGMPGSKHAFLWHFVCRTKLALQRKLGL
jgi:hypothetical protein